MLAKATKLRIVSAMLQLLGRRRVLVEENVPFLQIQIIESLQAKKLEDEDVKLRSLHKVLGMEQPDALRWLRDLEAQQMVEIEAHAHDLLEAKITVSERGIAWLKDRKSFQNK